jgi:hypothetical protein
MPGFFTPGGFDDPSLPVNSALRQRIALAMLSAKKGYPKTLGEGLTAIGDALGDRSMMRRLAEADVASQREIMGSPDTPAAPQPTAAYTPGDVTRSAYANERTAEPPARAETPLYTAPSQPSSMLASATPSGLTAPQPTLRDLRTDQTAEGAGAGASPSSSSPASEEAGGYNVIDAQAGTRMQQAPAGVRDAIARNVKSPDMQAYYGNLAAGEDPTGRSVSRSGARGFFQFTPGTARQYGLANPNDPDAATKAVQQFTIDNAAQFEKINGRPPTMQELAVMHQQGGVTGARMVAGTGNAPPRNLLLNNIAANASPQQAVARINNYYGMPDRTVDPRAGVAQALMAQQGGQRPPIMNADDQQQAALPPQRQMAPQMPAAAPPQMQIAQAPPVQPAPQAGYVMPDFGNLKQPNLIPKSEREMQLEQEVGRQMMQAPEYAPYGRKAQELATLKANREYEQARQNEVWKEQLQAKRAWDLEQQKQKAGAAENIARTEREQAQANAARLVDPDGKMVMGPDGVLRPPRTEGVANQLPTAKLNEADKKTVSFYSSMKLAEEQLKGKEQILANGLQDEALGKTPFVGNALMRRQYRMAKNAAELWVDQYNIHQTGAASRDNEWDRRFRNTIPRYGDDAAAIEQKRQSREAIMQGLYTGLGTQSGRAVADAAVKDNLTRLQNTRDTLNNEMKDRFPDAVRGTVKTRIRNGKKETRVFDGKNWLESTDGSD